MASPDRSALRRRLAWLAASLALLVLAGLAIWLARPDAPEPEPAPPPPAPAPAPLPPVPVVEVLTREDLAAAVEAALLPPLTAGDGERAPAIAGQRFQVVLPIRCPEALGAAEGASLTYTYDTAQSAVTLTARPQSWQGAALPPARTPGETFDAVEGFWIDPLPLAAPTCTRTPAAPAETPDGDAGGEAEAAQAPDEAAPPPRAGLAVFYQAGASRTAQRRERPYRVTRKAAPPSGPAPYNLVLSGRVAAFEAGPAIRCQTPDGEAPACLIAASIERVAFVDAATGEVLAEWRG